MIVPNTAWFLLKPSKMNTKINRYKLNPGDIIKIGRITLRIRDINFSSKKPNNLAQKDLSDSDYNLKDMNILKTDGAPLNNTIFDGNQKNTINTNKDYLLLNEKKNPNNKNLKNNNIFTKIEKKNSTCRICYMEEEDPENPLIQPCICSGSMKYIHLLCLKHWISTRSCEQIDKTDNCCVYIIKEVECELCKTKFPDIINYEGKLYPLLDFSNEFKDYLTLESLTLDKHKNKFIYVVSLLNSTKLKVGRGHKSDILLSDISVTRIHCYMVVEKQKVFLEDNNSKFGTLILVQTPIIKILEGVPLNIQIGRSYVQCKIKESFKLFNCCNTEESSNLYSYYNQNEKQIQQHINLIVGKDYNDINKVTENNIINNTYNQKNSSKFNNKFNCNSILVEQDKISDNEYFMRKHKKLTKNMTQAMIDDENDNNKNLLNINIEKNEDKDSENEKEEDNKNNKNLDNNCDGNNNSNKDINNETYSENIREYEKNKKDNEEEIDSIHLSDESKDSSST